MESQFPIDPHKQSQENPREKTKLDQELEERRIEEAMPLENDLNKEEDHQKRLATYLSRMTNQALAIMLTLENKESVKHQAAEDRKDLNEILTYLQGPTKDKIVTDARVTELQGKLNRIGQKYGILEDYSLN